MNGTRRTIHAEVSSILDQLRGRDHPDDTGDSQFARDDRDVPSRYPGHPLHLRWYEPVPARNVRLPAFAMTISNPARPAIMSRAAGRASGCEPGEQRASHRKTGDKEHDPFEPRAGVHRAGNAAYEDVSALSLASRYGGR